MAAYQTNNDGVWHTSKVADGLTITNPPDESFHTDPNYDFSIWSPAVLQNWMMANADYTTFMAPYGAGEALAFFDGDAPQVMSWYKLAVTGC